MTTAIALYVGMTLGLAAVVVLYAAQVSSLARGPRFWPDRVWSLLPGVSSVVAWRDGARVLPIAFAAALLLYATLWVVRVD